MSAGERMSSAFHRIAAVSSIRLVRKDETVRSVRHSGSVREVNERAQQFADEIHQLATKWEETI